MKNEKPAIVYVHDEGGDWEGVYVNGKLYAQNHMLSARDWLDLLFELGAQVSVVADWPGEKYGHLPQAFDELQKQMAPEEESC